MDINNMRNIVVLKDLPSNIVEEAFVILKNNQKIKRLEYAENKSENFSDEADRNNEDEYVIKEAELLVSNYIKELEGQDLTCNKTTSILRKKYKKLKIFATVLSCFLLISFVYILGTIGDV